jgi:tetratricopeptide (TPR) repeat protein
VFLPIQINRLSEEVVEVRSPQRRVIAHCRLTGEKLGHILSELDSADYMVRRRLFEDLKQRASSHQRCPCFQPCAKQLWLCYEIGFGTERNEQAAAKWRSKCTNRTWDAQEYMAFINDQYHDVEKAARYDRLSTLVGYQNAPATATLTKYREDGRLEEAEVVCRRELEARKQSMGPESRAYLAQLTLLSTILVEIGDPEQSLRVADEALKTHREVYGWDDIGSLGAFNYYINVVFHHGLFEQAEKVQLQFLDIAKQLAFDGRHRTYQTSRIMLVAIYHFQGRFDECLSEAKSLLEEQLVHLDETHPEVLNTRFWVCLARLVLGDNVNGILEDTRQLVLDYECVARPDDDGALLSRELLARVLLAMAKPDPSTPVNEEFLDESLQILVDGVLDRVEDPNGIYSRTDSESEETEQSSDSDLSMENANDDDSGSISEAELESQSGLDTLGNVNFSLLLVAYTTFICGLGFKLDFKNIRKSVPVVTSEEFISRFPESHLDLVGLKRVLPLVEKLKSLARSGITDGAEVDQILWALSHRWLLT